MIRKNFYILLNCLLLLSCKTKLPDKVEGSAARSQPIWLIPDAITAEKIAKSIWEAHLDAEMMNTIVLKAELKEDSIWLVKNLEKQYSIISKTKGRIIRGTLTLELSKRNGRIKKIEFSR